MPPPDRVYITLLAWPKRLSGAGRAEALVSACGLDAPHAQRLAADAGPVLVMALPPTPARAAVKALPAAGIPAVGHPQARFDELLPPFACKRLVAAQGAADALYLAEPARPRRDEPRGLRAADIRLIVRARLVRQTVESTTSAALEPRLAGAFDVPTVERVRTTTESHVSDVIDVYEHSGRAVRIDGDRFNFDVLGTARGLSDGQNAGRLATMLAERAPRAEIDLDFAARRLRGPAARTHRTSGMSLSGATLIARRDDHAAFDFYSVWRCLVPRTLAAARPTR